jgi:molybdate transport system substrate-binding protein
MKRNVLQKFAPALLAFFVMGTGAQATDITVMSSAAVKQVYLELVPQFEKASGHKVTTLWVGGLDVEKRIRAGEVVDLVILARKPIEALTQEGKLVAGSRVDLASTGVGVAVRAGAAKPDISSGDALKRALLAAKSIAHSSGPSGDHIRAMIARMGIAEEVKDRLIQTKPGDPVGLVVARGEAEIGFQQVSELVSVAGISFLGPLPPDLQNVTVFSGGVHTAAKRPAAARELMQFFSAPGSAAVIRKHGMEPG